MKVLRLDMYVVIQGLFTIPSQLHQETTLTHHVSIWIGYVVVGRALDLSQYNPLSCWGSSPVLEST
jgi:hypothetical protein